MPNRFAELKRALFDWGADYIEEFLGYEYPHDEDKDVTENRLDMAYDDMPDKLLEEFYEKFNIA